MENNANNTISEEDLLLSEIIIKVKKGFLFFRKKLWILLIISSIGAIIGFAQVYFSKPLFIAKVKFIMKDNGGGTSLMSSLGSLSSLLGGNSGPTSPLERTLAILGSERIVGRALLKSIIVDSKNDLAINHYVRISGFNQKWKNDSSLNNIIFSKGDNINTFNFSKRKAYKIIINNFINEKSTVLTKSFDKKSGVIDLSIKTFNESFSIEFCKLIYSELDQFIYNQQLNSSGKNVEILDKKIDSIKSELSYVQNSLARSTDRTLGLLMQEDKVNQKQLIMKEQMLTIMYGEAQKNLETFKFVNESINKGLEIIEYPLSPIIPESKSKLRYTLIGFFLSGIISYVILFIHNWFKEKLNGSKIKNEITS